MTTSGGRKADIVRRNNYGPSCLMLSVSVGWVCRRNRSDSVSSYRLTTWTTTVISDYYSLVTSKPDAADMQTLTFVDALMIEMKRVSLKMIVPFNWVFPGIIFHWRFSKDCTAAAAATATVASCATASSKRVIAKLAHYETVFVTALQMLQYTRERTLIKLSATRGVGNGDMSKQSS